MRTTVTSLAVAAVLAGCAGSGSPGADRPTGAATTPAPTSAASSPATGAGTGAATTPAPTSAATRAAPSFEAPGPAAAAIEAAVPGECRSAATPTVGSGAPAPQASDDVERLLAYGCAHLDEWAGIDGDGAGAGAGGGAGGGGTVVAWFTGHLAQHEAALRPALARPDAVSFDLARYPARELEAVRDEVAAVMAQPANTYRFRSLGRTRDVVTVELRADAHDLAQQLVARYGDRVAIRLGAQVFGSRHPGVGDLPCPDPPTGQVVAGLAVAVQLPDDAITSGVDFTGRVVVRNDGAAAVRFDTAEPLPAIVVDGRGAVVAVYDRAIAGTGRVVELAPGEQTTLRVLGATAACDPALGYALAPGAYSVVVVVPVNAGSGASTVDPGAGPIVARPAALTIAS